VGHDLRLDGDRDPLLQELLGDVPDRLQEAGEEEDSQLNQGEDDDAPDVLVGVSLVLDAFHHLVDQATGKPDLGDGDDALEDVGGGQPNGEPAVGVPDEPDDTDDAVPGFAGNT
jgi:hypothetical protein